MPCTTQHLHGSLPVWLNVRCFFVYPQVHDEVILEGPTENAEAARDRVVQCMANPWDVRDDKGQPCNPLRVELAVDANFADTWYEAK